MCDCCRAAQQVPAYRTYDPLCLHCGARYVKQLRELAITKPARESFGHDRATMRELAQGAAVPYADVSVAKPKKAKG